MITSDYPTIAATIARHAELETKTIVTGDTLPGMNDTSPAAQARTHP